MSGFREPGFSDRQKAAQEARKNLLNKFKSQPGPDDPAVLAKRAEREALAAKRAEAKAAREAEKAEQKRLEEEAKAAEAARIAREAEEAIAKRPRPRPSKRPGATLATPPARPSASNVQKSRSIELELIASLRGRST